MSRGPEERIHRRRPKKLLLSTSIGALPFSLWFAIAWTRESVLKPVAEFFEKKLPEVSIYFFSITSRLVPTGPGNNASLSRSFASFFLRSVILDSLKDITPDESEWLFMAISWLHDYSLLLWEFHRVEVAKGVFFGGNPIVPGSSGPFITNLLTRSGDRSDFSQLADFGVGRGEGT